MTSFSIKQRVLLLAILPLTMISIVFFIFFINKQINDIDINLSNKGNSIAKHLASASEYAIFSGNLTLLAPLLKSALEEEGVISITVTNQLGSTLTRLPKNNTTLYNEKVIQKSISNDNIFSKPVVQDTVNVDDFDGEISPLPEILGWVIVETSNEVALKRKHEVIYDTLFITLAILLISIYLATRISQRITNPIITLTKTVREIESGNLNVNLDSQSSGELLELERGIGTMIRSLKTSRHDLNRKIQKATNSLRGSLELVEQQNKELKVARQDALSASRAKSSFLANISHELRTPMNGILGFVKLLKKTQLSKDQEDYTETIETSANKLLQLINDVLDISQVEAGKLTIHGENFDLRECIEDVIILLTPAAHDKGIKITLLHFNDTPAYLFGPSDRIRQICINLIGNAIKFSEHGHITVRPTLEKRDDENVFIKISVTDQGPGISFREQRQLFNVFSQLENENTRKHGGAGLGLAISKSLAEAMGGHIGVESRRGEGSTFWFTFRCQPANPDKKTISDVATPNLITHTSLNGLRILIAEDNPINAKLVKAILQRAGANTVHVNNGKEAVEKFMADAFDIIIMDIQMPTMCGIEATQKIRKSSSKNSAIPILGLTANALSKDRKEFLAVGMNEVLIKPISMEKLVYKIHYWAHKQSEHPKASQLNTQQSSKLHQKTKKQEFSEQAPDIIKTPTNTSPLGVNENLVITLRKMLIDELPKTTEQLQRSFSAQDWESLREQIHRLLGGTSYCEVPELRSSIQKFQTSLRNQTGDLEENFQIMIREINKLMIDSNPPKNN